jgi:hypothetical protein
VQIGVKRSRRKNLRISFDLFFLPKEKGNENVPEVKAGSGGKSR